MADASGVRIEHPARERRQVVRDPAHRQPAGALVCEDVRGHGREQGVDERGALAEPGLVEQRLTCRAQAA